MLTKNSEKNVRKSLQKANQYTKEHKEKTSLTHKKNKITRNLKISLGELKNKY